MTRTAHLEKQLQQANERCEVLMRELHQTAQELQATSVKLDMVEQGRADDRHAHAREIRELQNRLRAEELRASRALTVAEEAAEAAGCTGRVNIRLMGALENLAERGRLIEHFVEGGKRA